VVGGVFAVESLWFGARGFQGRSVDRGDVVVAQRTLDGALEFGLNGTEAVPQLGCVRPSGKAPRPLEGNKGE
jgi:hypothetical protein